MDYAQFIPPGVISSMLGFPPEDEEIFRDIVHLVLDLIDLPSEVRGPLFEPMSEYFTKQIDDHIENPRDDLTSYLLNVEVGGNRLEVSTWPEQWS
jgi:cytochrome P450